MVKNMELKFDKNENFRERLNFIHYYAEWVKRSPNRVWSKQQAVLIDSFMQNSKNLRISPDKYLEMARHKQREKNG